MVQNFFCRETTPKELFSLWLNFITYHLRNSRSVKADFFPSTKQNKTFCFWRSHIKGTYSFNLFSLSLSLLAWKELVQKEGGIQFGEARYEIMKSIYMQHTRLVSARKPHHQILWLGGFELSRTLTYRFAIFINKRSIPSTTIQQLIIT